MKFYFMFSAEHDGPGTNSEPGLFPTAEELDTSGRQGRMFSPFLSPMSRSSGEFQDIDVWYVSQPWYRLLLAFVRLLWTPQQRTAYWDRHGILVKDQYTCTYRISL